MKKNDAINMDIEPLEEIQIKHDTCDTFEDMNIAHQRFRVKIDSLADVHLSCV